MIVADPLAMHTASRVLCRVFHPIAPRRKRVFSVESGCHILCCCGGGGGGGGRGRCREEEEEAATATVAPLMRVYQRTPTLRSKSLSHYGNQSEITVVRRQNTLRLSVSSCSSLPLHPLRFPLAPSTSNGSLDRLYNSAIDRGLMPAEWAVIRSP